MPLLLPSSLSREVLDPAVLKADFSSMLVFGPVGLGGHAIYISSFFSERRRYIPLGSVDRVFKRVAMSRGGFTGKGLFASISYLVVQFDNGKEKQAAFKNEEELDRFLSVLSRRNPGIRTVSREAEKRLLLAAAEEKAGYLPVLSIRAQESVDELSADRDFLLSGDEYLALQYAAKAKRADDMSSRSLKWLATVIVLCASASLAYGIVSLIHGTGGFGIYFTLFGLAAIFLFSGMSVLPTGRANSRAVSLNLAKAVDGMRRKTSLRPGFFLPPWYAHPVCLERMIRIIRQGRAESKEDALRILKSDLQSLNSDVQVDRKEYEEVVAIKPLFLIRGYE